MRYPLCFISKCNECACKDFCAKRVTAPTAEEMIASEDIEESGKREFAKVHAKRKLRAGKKLKDMNKEEMHEYWREQATKRRKRLLDEKQDLTPTGKKVMASLQKNADVLKKIKEENHNAIPERP